MLVAITTGPLLNLASLGAAYGVMVWIWQDGHASQTVWGIPATGAITMWVPVIEGIGRTGRLVTSAALILVLSFLAMSTGPETDLKILATGLGAGILVDATLIRCLLVPALVSLFGSFNWWLPAAAARILRVAPSPLGAAEDPDSAAVAASSPVSPGWRGSQRQEGASPTVRGVRQDGAMV